MEPAELGADLPRPLSPIVVDIVSDIPEDVSVVGANVSIALDSKLIEDGELLLYWGSCDAVENIAHLLSASVLDGTCNCISDVVHEVSWG